MNDLLRALPKFNVLLVEDNEDDVLITKHAFKNLPVDIDLQVAGDGRQAIAMLRGEPPYDNAIIPHVILLDLNMPQMDGRQLLAALKQDAFLKLIPALILSTSASGDDVANAYQHHASAYMTKPIDLHEFRDRMRRFADFWLTGIHFAQFERR